MKPPPQTTLLADAVTTAAESVRGWPRNRCAKSVTEANLATNDGNDKVDIEVTFVGEVREPNDLNSVLIYVFNRLSILDGEDQIRNSSDYTTLRGALKRNGFIQVGTGPNSP